VEFRVLGATEIRAAGRVMNCGPPQQRHVLAVLAASVGQPVAAEALIDRVWDDAPRSARRTLHVYMSGIRRVLGDASDGVDPPAALLRRAGGYVLDTDPERVDLHRFTALLERRRANRAST